MYRYAQIVEFPAPTAYGLVALVAVFFLLLGGAVALDARRKRALRRTGTLGQWAAVDRVMDERRLNKDERSVLRDLLKRHASEAPLEAVTSRLTFERMINTAMKQSAGRLSADALKEYGGVLRDIRIQLGLEATVIGQQISSTRELDGGQRMEIALEGTEDWIPLHVADVDEAYFYLRYRDEAPAPLLPGAGQRVKCGLWRDEDGRYTFTTTVVATEIEPPRMTLEHTANLKRTQSREHFRVRHDQSTAIGILNATLSDDPVDLGLRPPVTRIRGRITSLSAGGCAIVVQDAVSKRMLLRVSLELANEKPLEVHGQIVSALQISGGRHLLRVRFLELAEETADTISRHVMRKQQQMLAARQNRDMA